MTCTYLASKLDENTRRHRDVLTVFDRLLKKRQNINKLHIRTIDPHGKVNHIFIILALKNKKQNKQKKNVIITTKYIAISSLEGEFI